jgi:hypothetical protein
MQGVMCLGYVHGFHCTVFERFLLTVIFNVCFMESCSIKANEWPNSYCIVLELVFMVKCLDCSSHLTAVFMLSS